MSVKQSEQHPTTVRARIYRFDPSKEKESASHYDTYEVPFVKWMRVMDVLDYVAEELGEDLAYRWFCGVKKCGTCGVRMNGRAVLACWEPAVTEMTIEPLLHTSVIRDLVVDRQPYESALQRMHPWLERRIPYPGFPEPLTHEQMAGAANARDCIQCLCCVSACPVLDLGADTRFAGPALLVQLAQFALDPRDGVDRGRIAHQEASVFSCVSCYACEEACPAHIPIVSGVIEPLKAQAYRSLPEGTSRHQEAFMNVVKRRGYVDPSALVLRIQGFKALKKIGRVFRLVLRRKVHLGKTLFGKPITGIQHVRKLFDRTKGGAR